MASPIDDAGNVKSREFTHSLTPFDSEGFGPNGSPKSAEVLGVFVDAVARSRLLLDGVEAYYNYEIAHNEPAEKGDNIMELIRREFELVNFFNNIAVDYFGDYVKNILLLNEDSYHNSVIRALDDLRKLTPSNFGHSLVLAGMCMYFFDNLPKDVKKQGVQFLEENGLSRMDLMAAFLLHDIGKLHPQVIGCVESTKASQDIRDCAQKHAYPEIVFEVLEKYGLGFALNPLIAIIATQHQEHDNGLGYPFMLKGCEINFFARMVHIWDVVEAMSNNPISNRGYMKKVAVLIDQIWSNFIHHDGEKAKYDPELVAEANRLMHFTKRSLKLSRTNNNNGGRMEASEYLRLTEKYGKGIIFLPMYDRALDAS